jgi:putative endonuclease
MRRIPAIIPSLRGISIVVVIRQRQPMDRTYHVYVMANVSRTIYVGCTGDLMRRVAEHRSKSIAGFTRRYNLTVLVWFEGFERHVDAIARERELKGWARAKKIALIETMNPNWLDLADEWFRDLAP